MAVSEGCFYCLFFIYSHLLCGEEITSVILPIVTDVTIAWSVCQSVTLVHPVTAVGRNEMPFGSQNFHCKL